MTAAGGAQPHPLLRRPLVPALLVALRDEVRPRAGGAPDAAAQAQEEGGSVSLPRLAKRLGVGASAVLRELALMGDAALGGVPGPAWVRVQQDEGRWRAALTPAGLALAGQLAEAQGRPDLRVLSDS